MSVSGFTRSAVDLHWESRNVFHPQRVPSSEHIGADELMAIRVLLGRLVIFFDYSLRIRWSMLDHKQWVVS